MWVVFYYIVVGLSILCSDSCWRRLDFWLDVLDVGDGQVMDEPIVGNNRLTAAVGRTVVSITVSLLDLRWSLCVCQWNPRDEKDGHGQPELLRTWGPVLALIPGSWQHGVQGWLVAMFVSAEEALTWESNGLLRGLSQQRNGHSRRTDRGLVFW